MISWGTDDCQPLAARDAEADIIYGMQITVYFGNMAEVEEHVLFPIISFFIINIVIIHH